MFDRSAIRIGDCATLGKSRIDQHMDLVASTFLKSGLMSLPPEAFKPMGEDEPSLPAEMHSDLDGPELSESHRYVGVMIARLMKHAAEQVENKLLALRDTRGEPRVEIAAYLDGCLESHVRDVKSLAGQIAPMHPDCKISVCIPVAAHEEGKYIYQTLLNFHRQNLSQSSYEVLVFNNHPQMGDPEVVARTSQTFREIERFEKNHPDSNVRVMYAEFEKRDARIGHIRKMLTDVVLERYMQREVYSRDHMLLRADADTSGVTRNYVGNYVNMFERFPQYDAFGGSTSYPPRELLKNPMLYVLSSFTAVLDAQLRKQGLLDRPFFGVNVAFRASSYAMVGGYDPSRKVCEDVNIDCKIDSMRNGSKELKSFAYARSDSRLYTSPRRANFALANGYSPIEQWSIETAPFDIENPEVREKSIMQRGPVQVSEPQFQKRLDFFLRKTVRAYFKFFQVDLSCGAYEKAFDTCGIEWKKVGALRFEILNTDRMLAKIEEFQKNGMERFYRKTGQRN